MKLIIDIHEKDYQSMKNGHIPFSILDVLMRGTPLPEHHGRLGDLDALEKEIINGIKAGNYEDGYEEYAHINDMDDCVECVRYTPTIIEADKGSEKRTCANCLLDGTDACSRGAGRAVDDSVCEDFI